MSRKLSKILKEDIRHLAVNYQAFVVNINYTPEGEERDLGLTVWGPMLLASQEKLGIVMIDAQTVQSVVDNAYYRRYKKRVA